MKLCLSLQWLTLCLGVLSCRAPRSTTAAPKNDQQLALTIVQINDVYEIAPLEGGKTGGLARVATLTKQYRQANKNTLLVMAGDFVSPSVYNSLRYEGNRIRGRQMVEAMNAAGTDLAIFGNHEFDISEAELQARINESRFDWIASNAFHKQGDIISPFVKQSATGTMPLPQTAIRTFTDADGTVARIGFIGLTLPFNKAPYVDYTDPLTTAETLYNQIKDSCDAVVAITHQMIQDDSLLAVRLPRLALVIGGHEHDMRFQKGGDVFITKAHSNARSAYVIQLRVNTKEHTVTVTPELKLMDSAVAQDAATDSVVKRWMRIAEENYTSLGFDPAKIVLTEGEPLEGREVFIRTKPTNFSQIIIASMEQAVPAADVAIINSGAIRVDDVLQPPITQYDILRSLPFGGGIMEVDMKGSLLLQTLEAGRKNTGHGGFLDYSASVHYDDAIQRWFIKNQPIDTTKTYKVALIDFLLTGGEANMSFLTKDNPGIVKMYPVVTDVADPRSDVRLAIIRYMEAMK
jgi:2',3'-cyclic-nucleotide 2'-phosphodiesterase (5'-nucleotidase family)